VESLDASSDRAKTFALAGEDYTLGNALRYVAMRDPDVSVAAFTVPHPLESKVHVRIETHRGTAEDGLRRAAAALAKQCDEVTDIFDRAVRDFSANGSSS